MKAMIVGRVDVRRDRNGFMVRIWRAREDDWWWTDKEYKPSKASMLRLRRVLTGGGFTQVIVSPVFREYTPKLKTTEEPCLS